MGDLAEDAAQLLAGIPDDDMELMDSSHVEEAENILDDDDDEDDNLHIDLLSGAAPSAITSTTTTTATEPKEYPCQYCDQVFRSRQQRHYHVKIAKKCAGLQPGVHPAILKRKKMMPTVPTSESFGGDEAPPPPLPSSSPSKLSSDHLMAKLKERMLIKAAAMKGGPRRHSCPKCNKLFGKPSHVKRHLFTCRGPTFQRTSPIKSTSAAYYKQIQQLMSHKYGGGSGGVGHGGVKDSVPSSSFSSASTSVLASQHQRRLQQHLLKRTIDANGRNQPRSSSSSTSTRSTQSNFLSFGMLHNAHIGRNDHGIEA